MMYSLNQSWDESKMPVPTSDDETTLVRSDFWVASMYAISRFSMVAIFELDLCVIAYLLKRLRSLFVCFNNRVIGGQVLYGHRTGT